MMANYLIFDTY